MRFSAIIALLVFSVPAAAQETTPAEKPKEEKKICRRVEVTGSYLGARRECRTKADWEHLDERAQETLRRHNNAGDGRFRER